MSKIAYWKSKSLGEMSKAEWEGLCDGCGRCCLVTLEDEDTGERYRTSIACRLLDVGRCRCRDYAARHRRVADCIAIDADRVNGLDWLPDTCAYRLIAGGEDLAWWHPLVSGDPQTVHLSGASVRGWCVSEDKVPDGTYHHYIIEEK